MTAGVRGCQLWGPELQPRQKGRDAASRHQQQAITLVCNWQLGAQVCAGWGCLAARITHQQVTCQTKSKCAAYLPQPHHEVVLGDGADGLMMVGTNLG